MSRYNQLTKDQRLKLDALHKRGIPASQIASDLGLHRSTIYRELDRNRGKRGGYNANMAQDFCNIRKERFCHHRKLTAMMETFIKDKLSEQQWSPEQITGYCKTHGIDMVSHERIYQFIYHDKQNGGTLYKHLRICSKPYRKRYGSHDRRGKIPNRVDIDNRPAIVKERSRIGDWEVDTIMGTDHHSAVLTMVERKSRFLRTARMTSTEAKLTSKKMINALAPYKQAVHTITSDNGHEFADHQYISKKLQADYFFTHPYCAWEKGTNENTNGLIRQYVPKKTDMNLLDEQYLQHATQKLNARPRKSLNWKTPLEVFMANFNPSNSVALGS